MDDEDVTTPPPSPALQKTNTGENGATRTMGLCYDGNLTFPRPQQIPSFINYSHSIQSGSSGARRFDLPALISEGGSIIYGVRPGDNEGASCSESHLSEIMPDVAMATASMGHLQLNEPPPESLQLDLGDGSSHGIIGAGVQVCFIQGYLISPSDSDNVVHSRKIIFLRSILTC